MNDRSERTAPQDETAPPDEETLLPYETDPAAPLAGEDVGDFEAAARRANEGGADGEQDEQAALPEDSAVGLELASSMMINWSKVSAFLHACVTSTPRVTYGLGAKIPKDSSVPGRDFRKVDCSGFVRALVRRATDPLVRFPDGSVVQHDWVKAQGYPRETIADGQLNDGKVRIAFLSPSDSPSRIGHVVLIRNGRTVESHSGVGPNSRVFNGTGWQRKARVYRLSD